MEVVVKGEDMEEGNGEREQETGQGHGHGNAAGKISPKIFIGCALTAELKNHLSKSSNWKQASIEQTALTIIPFQEKEYLGIYHSENKITLIELALLEKMIKDKIQTYCPDLSPDTFKIITFPQIFIS